MQLRVRTCGAGSGATELLLDVDNSVQELRVADIKRMVIDLQPPPSKTSLSREDEEDEEVESFVLFRGRILMDADVIALHSLTASDFLVIATDQTEQKPLSSGSTELLLAAVPAQYCAALLDLPPLAAIDPFHALMHVKDSLPTPLLLQLNENPVPMLQLLTTPPVADTGSEPAHGVSGSHGNEAAPVDLTTADSDANGWTEDDDAAVGRVSTICFVRLTTALGSGVAAVCCSSPAWALHWTSWSPCTSPAAGTSRPLATRCWIRSRDGSRPRGTQRSSDQSKTDVRIDRSIYCKCLHRCSEHPTQSQNQTATSQHTAGMSGWALEEESLDTTSGVRAPASRAKGVFFAEQEDDRLVHQQPSSRRQQRGSKEVVLQSDGEDDDEDPVEVRVPPAGKLQAMPKAAGDTASYSSSKVKAGGKEDELSGADVVASAEAVSRPHARSEKTARTESLMETDAYVHHLVRDFLRAQGHNDVLQMLDEEKVGSGLVDHCPQCEEPHYRACSSAV